MKNNAFLLRATAAVFFVLCLAGSGHAQGPRPATPGYKTPVPEGRGRPAAAPDVYKTVYTSVIVETNVLYRYVAREYMKEWRKGWRKQWNLRIKAGGDTGYEPYPLAYNMSIAQKKVEDTLYYHARAKFNERLTTKKMPRFELPSFADTAGAGNQGNFLEKPFVTLQIKGGCQIDMSGSACVLGRDNAGVEIAPKPMPFSLSNNKRAFAEGGLIPPGNIFMIAEIQYKSIPGTNFPFVIGLPGMRLESCKDYPYVVSNSWRVNFPIWPGEENQVYIRCDWPDSIGEAVFKGDFLPYAPKFTRDLELDEYLIGRISEMGRNMFNLDVGRLEAMAILDEILSSLARFNQSIASIAKEYAAPMELKHGVPEPDLVDTMLELRSGALAVANGPEIAHAIDVGASVPCAQDLEYGGILDRMVEIRGCDETSSAFTGGGGWYYPPRYAIILGEGIINVSKLAPMWALEDLVIAGQGMDKTLLVINNVPEENRGYWNHINRLQFSDLTLVSKDHRLTAISRPLNQKQYFQVLDFMRVRLVRFEELHPLDKDTDRGKWSAYPMFAGDGGTFIRAVDSEFIGGFSFTAPCKAYFFGNDFGIKLRVMARFERCLFDSIYPHLALKNLDTLEGRRVSQVLFKGCTFRNFEFSDYMPAIRVSNKNVSRFDPDALDKLFDYTAFEECSLWKPFWPPQQRMYRQIEDYFKGRAKRLPW